MYVIILTCWARISSLRGEVDYGDDDNDRKKVRMCVMQQNQIASRM